MQVVCIKPFGLAAVGDVAEIPDGASVDPEHWAEVTELEPEPDEAPETPPEPSSPSAPAVFPSVATTPTEM